MPNLANDIQCTGCLACKDVCFRQAIKIAVRHGELHVAIDSSLCVECGACERVCAIMSPPERNVVNKNVYGGYVKDKEYRTIAASGAFVAIAFNFFDIYNDGIVVGASLQANQVRHICIEKIEDLPLLMNSKYVQSNTDGIYKSVLFALKSGKKVLFSGLPCQVAAVRNYVDKHSVRLEYLYTVDLICHGVATQEALDLHLKYYGAEDIVKFRDKNVYQQTGTSQCTVLRINGEEKVIDRKNDVFYNIFASWLLDRRSCNDCMFARLDRVADITIGDFWGHKDVHSKGVSLIMVNNTHGSELVKESVHLHLWEITMREAVDCNVNLWTGWKAIKWHPMVMWPDWFKKHLTERKRLMILTRRDKVWMLLWVVFKVVTNIHIKISRIHVFKQYKNLLGK